MIENPINFYEMLKKRRDDFVICSPYFHFFAWKTFLTHPCKIKFHGKT